MTTYVVISRCYNLYDVFAANQNVGNIQAHVFQSYTTLEHMFVLNVILGFVNGCMNFIYVSVKIAI